MSSRATALAAQFEQVNATVIAVVEGYPEASAPAVRTAEGWPVFFGAWHIADSYNTIMGVISLVANAQPLPPITQEMLDQGNAANLAQHGNCTRAEALTALRDNGAVTAAAIRALTDAQLDQAAAFDLFGGATMSAQQLIEQVLIGHTQGHAAGFPVGV